MDRNQISQLLMKHTAFTREELNTLRAGFAESYCISDNQTYVMARMNLELIDRIIHLDDASASLLTTANTLTTRILWLTIVGVAVAIVGVALSVIAACRG
ncbi:MAG: hypothetical protein ABSA78_10595 [Candidatus Sulfotelmatobacter sp.]